MKFESKSFAEVANIIIVKRIPLAIERVEHMRHGYTKVLVRGKYGIIDNMGTVICPIDFDDIIDFDDEYLCAKKNQKWGVINYVGETILNFDFETVPESRWRYKGNKSLSVKYDSEVDKYGYVNDLGEYVILPKFEHANDFVDGYGEFGSYRLMSYNEDDEECISRVGLIDETGNIVLNQIFNWLADVRNRCVWAYSRGRYYLINLKNHYTIEFAERLLEDPFPLSSNNNIVTDTSNLQKEQIIFFTGESCIRYKYKEYWGIMNLDGKILTQPIFQHLCWDRRAPLFGVMVVETDYKHGCVNSEGRIIVPMKYDDVWFGFDWGHCEYGPYKEIIYALSYDDMIDMYDKKGKLLERRPKWY